MRRNEVEPGSTMRVVTGLVLLVYAASLAQGILIEENQVTPPDSPAQDYSIALSGLTDRQQHDLASVPGVRAHALTMDSWTDPRYSGSAVQSRATALVATCAQLTELVRHSEGCGRTGAAARRSRHGPRPGVRAGATSPYRFQRSLAGKSLLDVTLPSAAIAYRAGTTPRRSEVPPSSSRRPRCRPTRARPRRSTC